MAWKFETWKEVTGMGGHKAVIMVIAGMISASAVVWYMRDPAESFYYTAIDEAEIVAAIAERENALFNFVDLDWAALNQGPWQGFAGWMGVFASTNGSFLTNAISPYAQTSFFGGLDGYAAVLWGLESYGSSHARKWVDLAPGNYIAGAYEGKPLWPLYGTAPPWTNYPYAIETGWWKTEIYANDDFWLPTNRYVSATNLHAIGKALSALRFTVDSGVGRLSFGVAGYTWPYNPPGVRWSAQIEGAGTDSFLSLFYAAFDLLADAEPDHYFKYMVSTPLEMLATLPYCRVLEHSGSIELYETNSEEPGDRIRIVKLKEIIIAEPWACVTVGTNCVVNCFGGLDAANRTNFWHNDYMQVRPSGLVGAFSTPPVNASDPMDAGRVATNAFVHFSQVVAWDGRFTSEAYYNYIPGDPDRGGRTNETFGWITAATNQAFVIDWHFEHFTNRATFWQ